MQHPSSSTPLRRLPWYRTEPNLGLLAHFTWKRVCSLSCSQSLARARILDKVAILPDNLATWDSLGIKWMKLWEFINYMDGIATIKRMELTVVWCRFLSHSWCVPDKVYCPRVRKFATLQTRILVLDVLVSKIPYLYIFFFNKFLNHCLRVIPSV